MNRPHTFSPASCLSYSNQVGSRQVTQPLRCVESPAGAGGVAAIWPPRLGAGGRGTGLGAGGRGGSPQPWLPAPGLGGVCVPPAPGPLFPINQRHLFWHEWGAARLHPHLFCPSERGKESSITETPSVSATDPKGDHQAKGEEGAWQIFPPTEVPPQVLERDPFQGASPPKPPHAVRRAGAAAQEGLSKAASQTKVLCLPLHAKPQLSPTDSSGEAPHNLPVPPGFDMAAPGGWHQLCLSPNLRAQRGPCFSSLLVLHQG